MRLALWEIKTEKLLCYLLSSLKEKFLDTNAQPRTYDSDLIRPHDSSRLWYQTKVLKEQNLMEERKRHNLPFKDEARSSPKSLKQSKTSLKSLN